MTPVSEDVIVLAFFNSTLLKPDHDNFSFDIIMAAVDAYKSVALKKKSLLLLKFQQTGCERSNFFRFDSISAINKEPKMKPFDISL